MIEFQRRLLGDRARNEAFFQALKKIIIPGQTEIADIGSGTGFLSFLAEKLGAKKCYLYEDGDVFMLGKDLGKANGMKRCEFVRAHSAAVKNPPKVDVVISETLGNAALEENIIETLNDAKRFLKPGGIVIPQTLEQYIAPVISPRIWNDINVWDSVGFDLDLSLAKKMALNNMYVYKMAPDELLNSGQKWDTVDFRKNEKSIRTGKAEWNMKEKTKIFGFAVWWRCGLIGNIYISTSPFDPPTHWNQIFLPLLKPLEIQKDDLLTITLTSDSRYEVGIRLKWETELKRAGENISSQIMDTE